MARRWTAFTASNQSTQTSPPPIESARSLACSGAKWNIRCSQGTAKASVSSVTAPSKTQRTAGLRTFSIATTDQVQERFTRITTTKATPSVAKVRARAASAEWSRCASRKTPTQTARTLNPCSSAMVSVSLEKSPSFGSRGGRCITSDSAASDSKMSVQAGSMISCRKAMCTGRSKSGRAASPRRRPAASRGPRSARAPRR